jgi:uncharacterized protein (UPF0333 family)
MVKKRGQISTEYLILISFILFGVLTALGTAMVYSTQIKDSIKSSQIESFAKKTISQSERVFYSGEPAKSTFNAYLPKGVTEINITENYMIITYETASGTTVNAFPSNVNLTGGSVSPNSGLKKITVTATSTNAIISE